MLENYLHEHQIIGVAHPGFFCIDTIVDDPVEFIRIVAESNYYISEIIMWDRVRKESGSKLGYGGPLDPRSPDEYYFSETVIAREFSNTATIEEYIQFITEEKEYHSDCDLYPGFTVARRKV